MPEQEEYYNKTKGCVNMANYNIYDTMNKILNSKKIWHANDAAGNREGADKAANDAKSLYKSLEAAGYGSYAEQLRKSNAEQAEKFINQASKHNKTEFRPYMYSLGEKYGLSKDDVNKLIAFDNDTGQISFGGKNIGNPTAIVNGTSYFADTSVLDNAFNDYINRSGKTKTTNNLYGENMSNATDSDQKLSETLFGEHGKRSDLNFSNWFEGSEADSIRSIFGLKGDDGYGDALASGAGSNGGNVDSFAQANANRIKAYYNSLANQNIIDFNNARINNSIVSDNSLASNILNTTASQRENAKLAMDREQQAFDNQEAQKQSEFERQYDKAGLMGYWGDTLNSARVNPWKNADGSVDFNIDYQGIEDSLWNEYNNTTNELEKRRILQDINFAREARNIKLDKDENSKQWKHTAKGYIDIPHEYTQAARMDNHTMEEEKKANYYDNAGKASAITGYSELGVGNPYFENGQIRNKNFDFAEYVRQLDEKLSDSGISEAEKNALLYDRANAWYAGVVNGNDMSDLTPSMPIANYQNVSEQKQLESAERLAKGQQEAALAETKLKAESDKYAADIAAETSKYTTDVNAATSKYTTDKTLEAQKDVPVKPDLTHKEVLDAINKGTITPAVIEAYNFYNKTNFTTAEEVLNSALDSDKDGVIVIDLPDDYQKMLSTVNTSKTGETHPTYQGVDLYGARLLEGFFGSDGGKNGSLDDFISYAVNTSKQHTVDLAQLQKVCRYLGFSESEIKEHVTDKIENASKNWKDGVKWKNNTSNSTQDFK